MNKVFLIACIACKNGVIDKHALLLHSNFTLCNIWKLTTHGSAVVTSDIVLAVILVLTAFHCIYLMYLNIEIWI